MQMHDGLFVIQNKQHHNSNHSKKKPTLLLIKKETHNFVIYSIHYVYYFMYIK